MMFRKKLIVLFLVAGLFMPFSTPRVQAMDPVTIAILAPVAIKAAEVMMPYVIQGLKNAGAQLLRMGMDVAGILKLPLGVVQSTVGAPIGMFSDGMKNIVDGLLAPLQLVWHTVTFPMAIFGYGS
jgi:threonine/homoserine efflux transporter RhtA